jgi:hypothetical protein
MPVEKPNEHPVPPPTPLRRGELRRTLATAGFVRSRQARFQSLVTVALIVLALAVVLAISARFPGVFTAEGMRESAVAAVLGVGVLVLGLQQWRAARKELSLDKFYERLAATNRWLDEYEEARPFAGPWPSKDGESDVRAFRKRMYVYLELDNLEYALAKYNLGYMDLQDAYRSLRTFRQRCGASAEFCELAQECVEGNTGFNEATRLAVASSARWAQAARAAIADRRAGPGQGTDEPGPAASTPHEESATVRSATS